MPGTVYKQPFFSLSTIIQVHSPLFSYFQSPIPGLPTPPKSSSHKEALLKVSSPPGSLCCLSVWTTMASVGITVKEFRISLWKGVTQPLWESTCQATFPLVTFCFSKTTYSCPVLTPLLPSEGFFPFAHTYLSFQPSSQQIKLSR